MLSGVTVMLLLDRSRLGTGSVQRGITAAFDLPLTSTFPLASQPPTPMDQPEVRPHEGTVTGYTKHFESLLP